MLIGWLAVNSARNNCQSADEGMREERRLRSKDSRNMREGVQGGGGKEYTNNISVVLN